MTSSTDHLVADYLTRVERAAAGLSPARREELLHDLREHIDVERAGFTTDSETAIRTVLERLGDPESIAAAATGEMPRVSAPAPPPQAAGKPRRGIPIWAIITVVAGVIVLLCLFAGAFFISNRESGPMPASPPAPTTVGLRAHH